MISYLDDIKLESIGPCEFWILKQGPQIAMRHEFYRNLHSTKVNTNCSIKLEY